MEKNAKENVEDKINTVYVEKNEFMTNDDDKAKKGELKKTQEFKIVPRSKVQDVTTLQPRKAFEGSDDLIKLKKGKEEFKVTIGDRSCEKNGLNKWEICGFGVIGCYLCAEECFIYAVICAFCASIC